MKRQLAPRWVIIAILLFPFSASAQKQVTFNVPKITGAIYITDKDVDLKKSPTVSSPQLQHEWDEGNLEDKYDIISANVWSDAPNPHGYYRSNEQLQEGDVLPMVQKFDGWVQTIYSNDVNPWIKADYCRIFPLDQIKSGMTDRYGEKSLSIRTEGIFKDWCAYNWENQMLLGGIYLGCIINEMAVLSMRIDCYTTFDEKIQGISIADNELRYGKDVANYDGGSYKINLDKLSDSDFNRLLTLAVPSLTDLVFYSADDIILFQSVDMDSYKGIVTKVNVDIPKYK